MGKDFFNMYKTGNIVYASAVARHFSELRRDAYLRCDKRVGKDLKKLYLVVCPYCHCLADNKRHEAIVDIQADEEINCCHCDSEFVLNAEEDVLVAYEKL